MNHLINWFLDYFTINETHQTEPETEIKPEPPLRKSLVNMKSIINSDCFCSKIDPDLGVVCSYCRRNVYFVKSGTS